MQEIDSIYTSYLFLKDSLRITGRIFDRQLPSIQSRTIFETMPYDEFTKSHSLALSELDNLVVLSLFAAFEWSLRDKFSEKLDVLRTIWPKDLGAGIYRLTNTEIERWRIEEIFSLFGFTVGKESIDKLKEVLKYRNWIAHGKNQNKKPPASIDPKTAYDAIHFFLSGIEKIHA